VAEPVDPPARCVVCGEPGADEGDGRCEVCREQDAQPFVCPGCHAFGWERCASWCPDAAIEQEHEESIEREQEEDCDVYYYCDSDD
jgi:hypothetical protein